jgi:holin-like protein
MRPFGEPLSSELGGATQQTHQGRRVSDWTLEIVELARRSNVLAQLGLLMTFQFIGEALVSVTGIPFPGPLCGMLLLLFYLYARGGPLDDLSSVGSKLVDNLGLLFVPAGTAIVTYSALFATDGLVILAALVISTLVAVLVGGTIAASAGSSGSSAP